MADELNLVMHVLMDLMERVKHLERGAVKTARPLVIDEEREPERPSPARLPIGSIKRHVTAEDQEKMIELFRAKLSITAIATQLNWSPETIHSQLRRAGVLGPRHKRGNPKQIETEDAGHKEDTEDTAYV